jgi:hypothetical protein
MGLESPLERGYSMDLAIEIEMHIDIYDALTLWVPFPRVSEHWECLQNGLFLCQYRRGSILDSNITILKVK